MSSPGIQLAIAGCEIQTELYRGPELLVYRAIRQSDGRRVIVKTHVTDRPGADFTAALRREYEALCKVRSEHLVEVVDWVTDADRVAMLTADSGGQILRAILRVRPVSLFEALSIALSVTRGLVAIHEAGFVHGSLNPAGIVVSLSSGKARISSLPQIGAGGVFPKGFSHEDSTAYALGYLAPEIVGRLERKDGIATAHAGADLYSLGCVLYELCTGSPPFKASEPRQVIHAHLARKPVPPRDLRPDLPEMLQRILLKLLEKQPEKRFQSAASLESDLLLLHECLCTGLPEPSQFVPGRQQLSRAFKLSGGLFGRRSAMDRLWAVWERARAGRAEVAVVTGAWGIGKTALLGALVERLGDKPVRVLQGRFEHMGDALPYAALLAALKPLLMRIYPSQQSAADEWALGVRRALGDHDPVLSRLSAETQALAPGAGSPLADSPKALANQLRFAVRRLLSLVASESAPILVAMDDLQWASRDSLLVLRDFVADPEIRHVAWVFAIRSQGPDADPLADWISDCREAGARLVSIQLQPLGQQAVCELLEHNRIRSDGNINALAGHVLEVCQGNPLHVHRYLFELHRNGILYRDAEDSGWICVSAALDGVTTDRDPNELIGRQLRALPEASRQLLNQAACLGANISLALLAEATAVEPTRLREALQPALDAGMVVGGDAVLQTDPGADPLLSRDFRFVHDRVHKAALDLTEPETRSRVRLELGRRLLAASRTATAADGRRILAITQLNQTKDLLDSADERMELSQINLDAALRARRATAFADMLDYLRHAESLLPAQAQTEQREFVARLQYHLAVAEHLTGDARSCVDRTIRALQLAQAPLLRCDLFDLLIVQYTLSGEYEAAISEGRRILAELELEIPQTCLDQALADELELLHPLIDAAVAGHAPSLRPAPDPVVAILRILINLLPPSDFADPDLNSWLAARSARLSVERGFSPESAKAFMNLANVLALRGEHARADAVARVALRIADQLDAQAIRPRILYTYACYISHWSRPLPESRPLGEEAFRACQAFGEIQYAGYVLAFHRVMNELFIADPLDAQAQRLHEFARFARQSRNTIATSVIDAALLPIHILLGRIETADKLAADAPRFLREAAKANNRKAICLHRILCGLTCLVHEQPASALAFARGAERDLAFVSSTLLTLMQPVLRALAETAGCSRSLTTPPERVIAHLTRALALLEGLSGQCPENFAGFRHLLLAEQARLLGPIETAVQHYDAAIELGQGVGFPPVAALAAEYAARLWADQGCHFIARAYLLRARKFYERWGAAHKIELIDARLGAAGAEEAPSRSTGPSLTDVRQVLDRDALIEASVAVGGRIHFDEVVEALMRLLMESTGAERALLVVELDQGPCVQASGAISDDGLTMRTCSEPLDTAENLPRPLIQAVRRSRQPILLRAAQDDPVHGQDPYIRDAGVEAVLCVPLVRQLTLVGVVYLENRLTQSAFSEQQIGLTLFVASQAAMAITNALLFETLEEKVRTRTADLEEARARAEAERLSALEASKAKSILLDNVSHELCTPLNAIIGFSDMLHQLFTGKVKEAQAAYLRPRQAEYIKDIYDAGQHLNALVNDMLSLSRLDHGRIQLHPTEISVAEIVNSSMMFVRGRAQDADIRLRTNAQALNTSFVADGQYIRQVLINLLTNAVKFTPPGGSVDVVVSTAADQIRFDVIDSGMGIATEFHERIFERFFRVSDPDQPAVPGTGLGLSLSRELVELHGGSLTLSSETGKGSTFSVVLPVAGP